MNLSENWPADPRAVIIVLFAWRHVPKSYTYFRERKLFVNFYNTCNTRTLFRIKHSQTKEATSFDEDQRWSHSWLYYDVFRYQLPFAAVFRFPSSTSIGNWAFFPNSRHRTASEVSERTNFKALRLLSEVTHNQEPWLIK